MDGRLGFPPVDGRYESLYSSTSGWAIGLSTSGWAIGFSTYPVMPGSFRPVNEQEVQAALAQRGFMLGVWLRLPYRSSLRMQPV